MLEPTAIFSVADLHQIYQLSWFTQSRCRDMSPAPVEITMHLNNHKHIDTESLTCEKRFIPA